MLDNFEKTTKPTFKDPKDRSFIKFGSMKDKDQDVGIRSGQITLEGCVRFFRTKRRIIVFSQEGSRAVF